MGKFVQLVVDGLSTGSVYGAIALAIVLVNQATGLIKIPLRPFTIAESDFAAHQSPGPHDLVDCD